MQVPDSHAESQEFRFENDFKRVYPVGGQFSQCNSILFLFV